MNSWPPGRAGEDVGSEESSAGGGPIRVLELVARLNIGGPAALIIELAAGLDRDRFAVEIAAGRVGPGEDEMGFLARQQGVDWISVGGLSPVLGAGNAAAFRAIRTLLAQRRPDVLHTHTAKAGALGRLAALSLGRRRPKLVHTFHGHVFSHYFSPAKARFFLAVERFLARFTDRIVVLSPEQAEEIAQTFRICSPERLALIPVGLDLAPFAQARPGRLRQELGLDAKDFLVGFVGRLTPIKDPLMLIRAAARAREGTARPVHLVLVGDGELAAEAAAEAGRLGFSREVHFLGWREELAPIYADLDLLALTSLNEGLPLVLIEALAAARLVASTPVGGVPGLLGLASRPEAGGFTIAQRGLCLSVGDEAGLASAIGWTAAHPQEAAELGRAGQDYVLDRHDCQAWLAGHAALYQSIAGKAGKKR